MNKIQLHQQLMMHLDVLLNNVKVAAKQAHETATSEENVAENKYDTLALEAAYLAQGQSQRVMQCQANIDACIKLPITKATKVELGALVVLMGPHQQTKYLLICPVAGGVKLQWDQHTVLVVTPHSPMGAALLNHQEGEEVDIIVANKKQHYEIIQII